MILKLDLHNNHKRPRLTRLGAFALAALMSVSIIATDWANALYILSGDGDAPIVLEKGTKVPNLSSKLVYVNTGASGFDISLASTQTVTIRQNGTETTVKARRGETVSALLARLKITPGPLDMIGVDVSGTAAVLTIASDLVLYEKLSEPASHTTRRVPNDKMTVGTEKVVQEGSDGIRTSIYEVVWSGGQQVSRQLVEELDSTAVDKIIEYGTAEPPKPAKPAASAKPIIPEDGLVSVNKNADGSGTLVFQSGEKVAFSAAKSMTATAYTAGENGVNHYTATGTQVRVGAVAVDKRVIPLGTRMYIVTSDGIVYGFATAEDTGVRGNTVDLYYDTYRECINFGRRSCTVYILE